MTVLDKTTEDIAHFIGQLRLDTDGVLHRDGYEDFRYKLTVHDVKTTVSETDSFSAPYDLLDYDPSLYYRPVAPHFPWIPPWLGHPHYAGETYFSYRSAIHHSHSHHHGHIGLRTGGGEAGELDPPGSIATYAQQHVMLSDNDVFSPAGMDLLFMPPGSSAGQILQQAQPTLSLSPLHGLTQPGSSAEIIAVVKTAADALGQAVASEGSQPYVLLQDESLQANVVNGQDVDTLPDLADYHSFEDDDEDEDQPAANQSSQSADGVVTPDASVDVSMGGDTLVNDAALKSVWTAGKVTAVVGDHVEVNAIIQVNTIYDMDQVTGTAGWEIGSGANDLFNIASFVRTELNTGTATANHAADVMPHYWNVTEIHGDLIVMDWVEQYIFMSDTDAGVLTSSGVQTMVESGGNLSMNHLAINEIGFGYDLIIVGGSLYDASIIQQTNVLFDNDVLKVAGGLQTSGSGTASMSSNLLWNQASIHNIGGSDRFDALPSAYADTADSLAGGGRDIDDGVLSDPAFAGLSGLRVLYIGGDLLNLQYIKQTSILGDNDQLSLVADKLRPASGEGWTVEMGGNALINNAAIVDLDSFGKTYVGGQQYSQETLIQAEFISSAPLMMTRDTAALASEAVVFLDGSVSDDDDGYRDHFVHSHDGTGADDGLQTILA